MFDFDDAGGFLVGLNGDLEGLRAAKEAFRQVGARSIGTRELLAARRSRLDRKTDAVWN
jgi:hypothetical protein